jgi:3'(2'),5'-bisphosphate nucleotidase
MEEIRNENPQEVTPSVLAEKIFKITEEASEVLMKYFRQVIDVNYKKDEFDPVTVADREADNLIREQLNREFPEDLILSEENEFIPDDYTGRVWMVDPLNGTKSFIRGVDTFAVVIGLMQNGVPIFGCVSFSAKNMFFYAEKDKGAYERVDGKFKKISTSSVNEIENARLITREPSGDIRPVEEKLNKIPFLERVEGYSGSKFCTIANGQAEAHINTNSRIGKWELVAQQIILEEAGGVFTDFDGNVIDYKGDSLHLSRSFVASANKKLHEKIIEEIARLDV